MDCVRFREVIQRYVDGELGDADVASFQKHLSFCPSCAAELDESRAPCATRWPPAAGVRPRCRSASPTASARRSPRSRSLRCSSARSLRRPTACCPAVCRAAPATRSTAASSWPRRGDRLGTHPRSQAARGGEGLMPALTRAQIMELIPHRDPFLLLDEVVELVPGRELPRAPRGCAPTTSGSPGTFPAIPVMPGVLIVEALAQAGAVTALSHPANAGKLLLFAGIDKVRFKRVVEPGDVLDLKVEVTMARSAIGRGKAVATVGGDLACRGELMFAMTDAPTRRGRRRARALSSPGGTSPRVRRSRHPVTRPPRGPSSRGRRSHLGSGRLRPQARGHQRRARRRRLDTSDEWIVSRTGIRERRICRPDAGDLRHGRRRGQRPPRPERASGRGHPARDQHLAGARPRLPRHGLDHRRAGRRASTPAPSTCSRAAPASSTASPARPRSSPRASTTRYWSPAPRR